MARLDITKLRKEHGMSQIELAQQLQITQSFLSAIENGKSPLPPEKEERLMELFGIESLSQYEHDEVSSAARRQMSEMTDSDLFNQLLQRFHQQAHSKENTHRHHDHHDQIETLQQRVDTLFERNNELMKRNDRLSEDNERLRGDNDRLRQEIDRLREEVFRLKS